MTIEVPLTDPGEKLIWSGNPIPARYALRKASYRFLFGIFFFGFSLFWINGAYTAGGRGANQLGFPFWMFGLPFVIVGASMVLSPAWQYFRGMQTTYALTDRRAIMNISGPFPRRISVPLNQVPFVEVLSSADGPGHVLFQEPVASYSNRGVAQRDGFIAIADAAQIGQMLRGAIEKSAGARVSGLRQ
jgi:hypothetical protein